MNLFAALATASFAFLSVISTAASAQEAVSPKTLIIVDMQDFFAVRGNAHNRERNPEILRKIFERQKWMITAAKAAKMPIVVVEYEGIEPTNKELMSHIGEYQPVEVIRKKRDGLFDDLRAAIRTKELLGKWNSTTLVVMGANGGACVEATIRGALESGYKVQAYTDGIADFNYQKFQYPYSYRENLSSLQNAKGLKIALPSVKARESAGISPKYKAQPSPAVLTGDAGDAVR